MNDLFSSPGRPAKKYRIAGTNWSAILHTALCIGSTRVGRARVWLWWRSCGEEKERPEETVWNKKITLYTISKAY